MITLRNLLLAAILVMPTPGFAQSPQDHEVHHPDGETSTQGPPAQPASPTGGTMGPGMMGRGMMSGGTMGQGQMGSDMMTGQGPAAYPAMPMTNMMMRG